MAAVIQLNIVEILYVALNQSSFDLWFLKAHGPLLWLVHLFDLISMWGRVWGLGTNPYTFHSLPVRNCIRYFWNARFFYGEWANLHGNWMLPKLRHVFAACMCFQFNTFEFLFRIAGAQLQPAEITQAFPTFPVSTVINIAPVRWNLLETIFNFSSAYLKIAPVKVEYSLQIYIGKKKKPVIVTGVVCSGSKAIMRSNRCLFN